MSKTVNSKILIRRDTTANWLANNPTLAAGEIGFDTTVGKHKIGDGRTQWTDLSYFALVSDLEAAVSGIIIPNVYYVTPEDYGAVGDGETDDSQAVQDAVDAGYAVYFDSNKTYYLASTVTIDHDCHLFGGENTTIMTKTPSVGTVNDAFIITGTLKKTTTLTTDYTSTGVTANSGNKFTLSDMTDIDIGDIMMLGATDQYYSYSRQYYFLGATLLISDIYDGHIYTSNSMPFDVENTEDTEVKILSAPTAIIENLNFVSDLDSLGNYKYFITIIGCKNSVIRNCNLTNMDGGIDIAYSVNTLIEGTTLSKSKYDNTLSGDGYGIYIGSCSNTVISRVIATCGQSAIDLSGDLPNIDTFIRDCNLGSECRAIGLGMHENVFNVVVEDCTLAGMHAYGTATINRCRFIQNNRVSNPSGIVIRGSHDPRWAKFKINDCVFDGELAVEVTTPVQQSGIQAIDNVVGSIEINNCTGGRFIYRPSTSSTILSNTIQRLAINNWRDCKSLFLNGSAIDYAEVADCSFTDLTWLNTNHSFGYSGINAFVYKSSYPQQNKLFSDTSKYGAIYYLPAGVPITFSSSDTSAHYQVCGKNMASNDTADYSIGNVTGTAGNALSRTVSSTFASALSVNSDGQLVFTQPNSSTSSAIYSKCLTYIDKPGVIAMSCTLKNTGETNGPTFYPYIAVVNAASGKIRYRNNGTSQTVSSAGATVTHYKEVYAGEFVLCYLYCSSAVANSETTLEDFVIEYLPLEGGTSATYIPYDGSSCTGDGTLNSVSGRNHMMVEASSAFSAKFAVDYLENPLGSLPSAEGVNF